MIEALRPALASLRVGRLRDNLPFTPGAGPNGGEFFLPWRMLRERFAEHGVELNTPDRNAGRPVAFELHLNARRSVRGDVPCHAFLYEDSRVRPLNADLERLRRYRRIFTWNEELIDGDRFLRLEYPNDLRIEPTPATAERRLFCVMIASNKALLHADPQSLHERRIQIIRAFERDAPELFELHGRGWDRTAARAGRWGRVFKRLQTWQAGWRRMHGSADLPFPSYRGPLDSKDEVLRRARFAIAYENSRGAPGYVTEKIFDCFRCGCVPVYIGPANITDYVPADCFVDGDGFADAGALIRHLRDMSDARHARYRAAIAAYLASPASQRFSNAHFCATLVAGILHQRPKETPC